uniref:Uncharacterized protein n=1 Tax=Romanomermis culicivorax TaxID=13658 RepID=A0A915HSH7_ROMCU
MLNKVKKPVNTGWSEERLEYEIFQYKAVNTFAINKCNAPKMITYIQVRIANKSSIIATLAFGGPNKNPRASKAATASKFKVRNFSAIKSQSSCMREASCNTGITSLKHSRIPEDLINDYGSQLLIMCAACIPEQYAILWEIGETSNRIFQLLNQCFFGHDFTSTNRLSSLEESVENKKLQSLITV